MHDLPQAHHLETVMSESKSTEYQLILKSPKPVQAEHKQVGTV